MDTFNGKYEQTIEVLITSESHRETLDANRQVIYLCKAWGLRYFEHKSARKGDVLKRSIQIIQNAYGHDIITFSESLKCICSHIKLHLGVNIAIGRSTVEPQDSRRNLID